MIELIIDIHSHILPGLDDGSENLQESIEMLQIAIREGIKTIVVTPHYEVGMDENWLIRYKDAYCKVYKYIADNKLPIKLFVGNEIFYSDGVIKLLTEESVATLNGTKYVLVEFPLYADFEYIKRAVLNLQYSGFWPIIAHVERYACLDDINKIKELVCNLGAYLQINASTVNGRLGVMKRMFAIKLIRNGLIHFMATDSHGAKQRRPRIQESIAYIDKKCGSEITKRICETNPYKVLKGEKIGE